MIAMRLIALFVVAAMLAGCGTTGLTVTATAEAQPVDIPDPPACLSTVSPPAIAEGDSAQAALGEAFVALNTANDRISCGRSAWRAMQATFSGDG